MTLIKSAILSSVAAVAVMFAASSAHAQSSDSLTLFGPTGNFIGGTTASDAQEVTSAALPLFSFDHNLSNPAFMGHFVEVIDAGTGLISDVVGVDNEGGAIPNHMAFMSTDAAGGITAGMLAAAGFTMLDAVFVQTEPESLDSRLAADAVLNNYINPSNPAGSYLLFASGAPDGGSAVALLGIALTGIEGFRRVLRRRSA